MLHFSSRFGLIVMMIGPNSVKKDLKRIEKKLEAELNEEITRIGLEPEIYDEDKVDRVVVEFLRSRFNAYENEFCLAKRTGLLAETYFDGVFGNTVYFMKGFPEKDRAKHR